MYFMAPAILWYWHCAIAEYADPVGRLPMLVEAGRSDMAADTVMAYTVHTMSTYEIL